MELLRLWILCVLAILSFLARSSRAAEATPHEFPSVVVIDKWVQGDKKWVPVAHGTLYNPSTVLITAKVYDQIQSLIETRTLRIAGGIHDYKVFENTRQYRHPCAGEKHTGHSGDVKNLAVLHMSEPFRFNKFVQNLQLPMANVTIPEDCKAAGFGDTFEKLKTDKAKVEATCEPSDPSIICSKSEFAGCKADAGAPLVCAKNNRMFLYGIVLSGNCPEKVTNYFAITKIDLVWLTAALNTGKTTCRPTWSPVIT